LADEIIENNALQASSRIVLFNNVPQGLAVDADREQLGRALTNLVRNAIQAIETSELESSAPREGSVKLKAWREGAVVFIEIRDNGPGIPERVRARLFEPFQSAARPGGTGLGLAIAAELVRAHGGQLKLESSGPEGTAFLVEIPDQVAELRAGRRGERRLAGN
jgi:signal transduction histidine kinase